MEEEISLKEIIVALWQGRYIIIAFTFIAMVAALLISLFLTTPLYEAKATVYTDSFIVNNKEALQRNGYSDIIKAAVADLTETPGQLAANTVVTDDSNSFHVSVKADEPAIANQAASEVGVALLNLAADYKLFQLNQEKNDIKDMLLLADERMAQYFVEGGLFSIELARKKETVKQSISLIDEMLNELYPPNSEEENTTVDPAYTVLQERKGELYIELIDIRLLQLKEDEKCLLMLDIIEDPEYKYLCDKIEKLNNDLFGVQFTIERTEQIAGLQDPKDYVFLEPALEQPVNVRWPLNTAVAGVLGLMLSVMIVFIKPHLHELTSELKENTKKE